MVTKKQLLFELMSAALNAGVTVKDFVIDDPIDMGLEPTIAAKTMVGNIRTELLYGQVGDGMTLWLAHGVKCLDVAAANAAIEAYEETPLGQKFCVENEVSNEQDNLFLSCSFPGGREVENIAALREIFLLFSDPASAEKLSALMRCFA